MSDLGEIINNLQPSEEKFLKQVSHHIDDEMLREISVSDYGYGADESLSELSQIRESNIVKPQLSWSTSEVLTLYLSGSHNSKKEDWKKIFACTILLRTSESKRVLESEDQSWILSILTSMENLGMQYAQEAIKFFAWYTQTVPNFLPNYLFSIFAIIWIALKEKNILKDHQIVELIKQLHNEEEKYRNNEESKYHMSEQYAHIWLVGFSEFRAKQWLKLIAQLKNNIADISSSELKCALNKMIDDIKT